MAIWAIVMTVLAEGLLHYFPWRMVLHGKKLPRVAAYVLGVLGLMLPFTGWLWTRGACDIIVVLWTVIAAGGITVMAAYWLDRYLDLDMRNIEAEEREGKGGRNVQA